MKAKMIAAAATLALNVAMMPTADARDPSHCAGYSETTCTAEVGCKWRAADEITSKNTGKTKQVKAACMRDSKAEGALIKAYKAKG